jgi:ABC-2 type transport system permease protein
MKTLLNIELYKIFTRKRSYISFIAVVVIILIAQAAMLWEGQTMHEFLTRNLSEAFYMQGNLVNGYLMTYLVLNFLWVHIPLLVVIVTGDLFSGEAHGGTFRLILTRPVSRTQLVTVKYLAALVYTMVLMLLFALISLGLGLMLFGQGDLMVIFDSINIIPREDLPLRFLLAFIYGFIAMISVASLSLLLSSMASNSLGPILVTMAIIILFTMISSFQLRIFESIKPFLLTSYLDSWQQLFSLDINRPLIWRDAAILVLHTVLFYIFTVYHFRKKDILT